MELENNVCENKRRNEEIDNKCQKKINEKWKMELIDNKCQKK